MKIYKIKVPLYFQSLHIVVGKKFTKSMNKLRLDYNPKFDINQYESFVTFQNEVIYIFVRSKTDAGVIAHESIHIANYIFKHANIEFDINNDEPYAYLMGWVVEEIHKAIKK